MSNESRHQHDEEDGVDHKDDASIKVSNSQRAYQASNESKKQLFLMCLGLTEKGTPVFDLDAAPWRDIKKREIKPSRIALGEEIRRRMSSILPCNAAGPCPPPPPQVCKLGSHKMHRMAPTKPSARPRRYHIPEA